MYVELHARSAFSFLEGASIPEELATVCAQLKMPAMALLDADGVYGAPRFHLAAKKIGIKAHIGAEVTCDPLHPVILSGENASRSEAPSESKACPEPVEGDPYSRQDAKETGVPRNARNDKLFRISLLVSSAPGTRTSVV